MYNRIPPASLEVLKALYYFHYLNNPQLVELGIAKSEHSLNVHALAGLVPKRDKLGNVVSEKGKQRSKYLCNNLRYRNTDQSRKGGKLPYLHYLTKAGANYLYWACEDELMDEEIWFPTPKETMTHDYFHRTDYISAHIYLRRWAQLNGAEIDFATHDYQGDPNRPEKRGRPVSINSIVWDAANGKEAKPDGIFGITHNDKKRMFVVELHETSQTKLVTDQLYRNFRASQAIKAKFPDYQTSNDPFVLSIHTNRSVLKATKKRVLETPTFEPVLKGLMFAHLEDLKTDFENTWEYSNGEKVDLFKG